MKNIVYLWGILLFVLFGCKSRSTMQSSNGLSQWEADLLIDAAEKFQQAYADSLSSRNWIYTPDNSHDRHWEIAIDSTCIDVYDIFPKNEGLTSRYIKFMGFDKEFRYARTETAILIKFKITGEHALDVFLLYPKPTCERTINNRITPEVFKQLVTKMYVGSIGFGLPLLSYKLNNNINLTFSDKGVNIIESYPQVNVDEGAEEILYIPSVYHYNSYAALSVIIIDPIKKELVFIAALNEAGDR